MANKLHHLMQQHQPHQRTPPLLSSRPPQSSHHRELLHAKMKQEAWVVRRVAELTKEGLWSSKRIPKVCERPRPKTRWDCMLQEMQWLSVDFYQERQWKKAAAKLLAHSAKDFVEKWEDVKRRVRDAEERSRRVRAGFVAGEVREFWANVGRLSKAQVEQLRHRSGLGAQEGANALCNGNLDSDDDESMMMSDDESTISEQERFEKEHLQALEKPEELVGQEVKQLCLESVQPLETLIPENYGTVLSENSSEENNLENEETKKEEDDEKEEVEEEAAAASESSEDAESLADDDDSSAEMSDLGEDAVSQEEAVSSLAEIPLEYLHDLLNEYDRSRPERAQVEEIRPVQLRPRQRKLYDDYLAKPSTQSTIEAGEVKDIAEVLSELRKICNHPRLAGTVAEDGDLASRVNLAKSFPRVADVHVHRDVLSALDYDPFKHIDLNSLNLIYRTHDFNLTAISSDRIRRFCAPKRLIEELPERANNPRAPPVPEGRLTLEIQSSTVPSGSLGLGPTRSLSRSLSLTTHVPTSEELSRLRMSSSSNSSAPSSSSTAFHPGSLSVIARFNERRCKAMPLYGQDLLSALSIVDCVKPTRTRFKGSSYVNCLHAERGFKPSSSKSNREGHGDFRHKTSGLTALVATVHTFINTHSDFYARVLLQCSFPVILSQGWSLSVQKLQHHVIPTLNDLSAKYKVPLKCSGKLERHQHTIPRPFPSDLDDSSKLSELDKLLQEIRGQGEKAVVFCEMEGMLYLVREYLHRRHYPFVYLSSDGRKSDRLKQLSRFTMRGDHVCLLLSASTKTSARMSGLIPSNIANVIFVDSAAGVSTTESRRWCRILARAAKHRLTVHRYDVVFVMMSLTNCLFLLIVQIFKKKNAYFNLLLLLLFHRLC